MNIERIAEAQAELDDRVAEKHDIELSSDWNMRNRLIAFRVELSELANEIGFFKYWKQGHQTDKFNEIEELVDCIHFLVSIGNTRRYTKAIKEIEPFPFHEEAELIDMFEVIMQNPLNTSSEWIQVFKFLLGIGKKLGYSEQDMEDAYFEKNQKNHTRQDNGY